MSEKQFPPSLKRLLKARSEGKVIKTRLVSVAVTWWTLVGVIIPGVAWVSDGTLVQWTYYAIWTPDVAIAQALWFAGRSTALFVGAVALAGVAVGVLQTRGLFQPMQLARGLESYRVGAFVGRLRHNLVDAALGGVRACVVVAFLFPLVWLFLERAPLAWEDLSAASLSLYGDLLKGLWMRGGMALVAIAGVGYALARWQFLRKHRMSLQEMKEEHRDDEGDQHTKALRKHEHRAMLFSEVEKRVRRSKVVIVRRGT